MLKTSLLSDPRFEIAAVHFANAARASRNWDSELRSALEKFGDRGSHVSGCGRDHFPEPVKNALRRLALSVAEHNRAGYAARPPRVRKSTMLQLARLVIARDGTGFYGIH